ncbi:Hypothetical protein CINCED_3A022374 [Cinara cedri]|uniref:Uncharacterized protein n=1 Tax=Cinara cedri TaxID=506608 RepID=A0A5E4NMW5_9HEMI|nr:Hypothetical protein CINCED_3A022374 [Cinara cedri]
MCATILGFVCVKANKSFIGCVIQSRFSNTPLISKVIKPNIIRNDNCTSERVPVSFLSKEQTDQLGSLIDELENIFSTPEAVLGLFPDLEMEIVLNNKTPIKCKPYKAIELDREFMRNQVDIWNVKYTVCQNRLMQHLHLFIEQPFHKSTPKRLVIDYPRTINPVTVKDPFLIDQMDLMLNKVARWKYKSLVDVKQEFSNFKIKEEDIYKTAAVTTDHHIEFCRVIFGLTNAPPLLARAISTAYGHLIESGLTKYYDQNI